ncbi:MAG: tRNA preQ1(34) S-adenosylmethionine ribosyltransferase-isomerase QueA, partial [Pseudomonadota bacterium]
VDKKSDNIILQFDCDDITSKLDKHGIPPLPPYILRGDDLNLEDKERYQTIYAKHPGSAAAPTAGLHFSKSLVKKIGQAGIKTASVTLHVGLDTFSPVRVENVLDHKMHGEKFIIDHKTALLINETRKSEGRIIAVGTTSVRALESSWNGSICLPGERSTDIYITPGYKFNLVDAILTNFHQPKSTLLMLVSAFAGREFILKCYEDAIQHKYRLFSYGDCMFII